MTLEAGGQAVPPRVAGSVVQLGVLARILAPAVAISAVDLGAVSLDPDELWWQDDFGGAFALSVAPAVSPDWPGAVVEEFNAVFAARYGVPLPSLWGNIASGVNSAARQLARARPRLVSSAWSAADAVLADPRVEGGRLRAGEGFRRRSCCLIYQAAGSRAAVCGDCVLAG